MPGHTFLRGEAVTLRPIEEDDATFLAETINHPDVWPSLGAYKPLNHSQEREWIESLGESDDVHLLVCAEDEPVGTVGLNGINDVWGTAELGYYLHPDAQGNGYARDAAERIVRYGFEDHRLAKVYANVYAGNDASQGVLESVGFKREGVFRDHAHVRGERVDVYRYGLLAEEFDAER
ncbi:putative acetyltransferase protein [Halorhabdus tiamatea SARL4B]|uniref:GCN5-related N-acetyltransferase n=1 Tax=Halorhabdus tiamatea SARL4B TaxID=1033806 RepID=F7PLC3_9EURY|nr:GNAT family protein [Halorhabdus tiamatea]ERJ05173.1 putative acetyltransferase protein [Halorhabdus tiamatea SARL4B]CCQ34716.1 GCN5-related N-acetyltransferase [Halorhabdus tiamatea SARL4B]